MPELEAELDQVDDIITANPNVTVKRRIYKSSVSERWLNFRTTWKKTHAWPVFYSALVANILSLNYGITIGYASPAIPELQTDDEVTSINDTSIVFSALVPFGAMVTGSIAGLLLDALG